MKLWFFRQNEAEGLCSIFKITYKKWKCERGLLVIHHFTPKLKYIFLCPWWKHDPSVVGLHARVPANLHILDQDDNDNDDDDLTFQEITGVFEDQEGELYSRWKELDQQQLVRFLCLNEDRLVYTIYNIMMNIWWFIHWKARAREMFERGWAGRAGQRRYWGHVGI